MATLYKSLADQRKHQRYLVSGIARIQSDNYQVLGRLAVVGGGGLLVHCDLKATIGEVVTLSFSVSGFNEEHHAINARGRIAWSQPRRLGVEFLEEPLGLRMLMRLLENRDSAASRKPTSS